MSKRTDPFLITAADPVAAPDAEADPWIKLLPAGTFSTRDGRGPFTAGDATRLHEIISRTKAHLGTTQMMVDYDHQAVFAAVEGVGGTAKAAGWISEFEARDDGIYGQVTWTEAARVALAALEYRYLSPVFLTDKTSAVVRLVNVALVNLPAMDLSAIAARAQLSSKETNMDQILAALGLAEGAAEADALAALRALQDTQTAICAAAGLPEGSDSTALVAAVQAAFDTGAPDPTKYVPIDQVTALQNELAALQASLAADKAEALVTAAVQDGKLAPALKDWGLQLATADPQKFTAFTATAPVLTATQLGSKPKEAGDPDLSDPDR
jgi:phage I-like protein